MQVSPHDIDSLVELQNVDLDLSKLKKELEDLPQRAVILSSREKREALEAQLVKISSLHKDAEKKMTRINDEDASLAKKENGVQAAIEAAHGDFRGVEARAKELNGIFKRRETLSQEKAALKSELDKINGLKTQVENAIADCEFKENNAIEDFKAQGGAITKKLNDLKSRRHDLIEGLDKQVASVYMKTADLVGSVTLGKLSGNSCSVCRASIEGGHLIDLRANAPMGRCPSCGRLLIIEED